MLSLVSALMAVAATIVGILLLIAAVVVGYAAVRMIGLARSSQRWPTSRGRVLRSEIFDGRAVIRYAYTVDGAEYEGRDVAAGDWPYRTARRAAHRLQRYPMGALVSVYYDPSQPSVAILKPGLAPEVFYLPVLGSLLALTSLALLSWITWRLFF